jgi:hypothetical protein
LKGSGGSGGSFLRGVVRTSSTVLNAFHFDKIYTKGDSHSIVFQLLNSLIPPLVGQPPWEKLPKSVLLELKQRLFSVSHYFIISTIKSTMTSFINNPLL